MLTCAYCGKLLRNFQSYRCHLKVLHNKRSIGDRLICGQDGCPLDYMSAGKLQKHIARHHSVRDDHDAGDTVTFTDHQEGHVHTADMAPCSSPAVDSEDDADNGELVNTLREEIYQAGAFRDAAHFIARLRSNPKVPLSVSLEIIESCQDLFTSCMSGIRSETMAILHQNNIDTDRSKALLEIMSQLEKPFKGLETIHKQTKYFEQNGFYIAPQSFIVGQYTEPVVSSEGITYITKPLTGEYVKQADFFKSFLTLPGVLHQIMSYMECERDDGLIYDFKDGLLWKNHPIRLKHVGSANTVVIPVFDFFDDLETVNPLGSHACIHKIGCKYTIIKSLNPACNSKLENLPLNMIFRSSDRTGVSNRQLLDVYLSEMTDLEEKGLIVEVDKVSYQVFICLVQVTGDNLGLNGILGFVESFTACYPCRLCKVKRNEFAQHLTETDKLRTRDVYDRDVVVKDSSKTGIKEECCYNVVPSFHVSQNVYCDIMHDLLEGICRYVMLKVLQYMIVSKSYFSLDTLNLRINSFVFDHSSRPSSISDAQLKGDTLIMGAIEMLNFVLGFGLMVGDLVPEDDECWDVYLLLRQVLLFSCGLCFSASDLRYMEILIAEFLGEYIRIFHCSITLKFHNLTHYPRIIATLGPLYHIWVMRCEAKHADAKKVASSSGNFKNVCRTIAVRHQMKQSARLMAQRGIGDSEVSVKKCDSLILHDIENGLEVSNLLGDYGVFREIFSSDRVAVNSVTYKIKDVLVAKADNLFPELVSIDRVLLTDTRECYFVCHQLHIVYESRHYQAFQIEHTDKLTIIAVDKLSSLPSPWPLNCCNKSGVMFVSLRHKLW